ncbi:MAG: protein-disulfide reductase DsbD [Betaproteobacteria bacterium]
MMRVLLAVCALLWTLAAGAEEFLDPSVAFKPTARALDAQTVEVDFAIAKGYYLYRDKFRFAADGIAFGTAQLPKGKEKVDDTFGKVEVYYNHAIIRLPVERNTSGPLPLDLQITSQGCADGGICYPPQTQRVKVELPAEGSVGAAPPPATSGDESGRIAQALKDAGFWGNIAFFFIAGLGLALTPCVFPMIPILSGIIAGQGHHVSRGRGLALSLAYVLGMAITYAAAGVAAGLSGTLISGLLQNAWVLGGFALVFVVLALSMFGFFSLQLPTALQSKISEEAGHFSGGRGLGVLTMGALSALIVGPCVAAPLAGALLYIGQTGDAVLGGSALFALALGMGVPLIVVGVSAGTLLPKAGAWMEAVKKAFGVVLLGTALWLVSPLLPSAVVMGGWALLLIVPAVFLRAIDPLPSHAPAWQRFWKGMGIVLLLCGSALLVGALAGSRDPLQPLAGLRAGAPRETDTVPFQRVTTLAELEAHLKATNKPVMLDFWASWCVECKKMERETFTDPAIRQRLAGFNLVQADVTESNADSQALLTRFKLYGPPAIVFFDAQGREVAGLRIVGYQDPAAFAKTLEAAPGAASSSTR